MDLNVFQRQLHLFRIENLVLWAKSEEIGCAVNIRHGIMEYWVKRYGICFYKEARIRI